MKLLVTGAAGFIGSNFVHYWLREYPQDQILVLDKLTYAGNSYLDPQGGQRPANLKDLESHPGYTFQHFDICCVPKDGETVQVETLGGFQRTKFEQLISWVKECDTIVHFAAESHVDRSVLELFPWRPIAGDFVLTNVWGTHILLEAAVKAWRDTNYVGKRFHHVSTDEVFGELQLGDGKKFDELTPYQPRSPYAASKASSDHLVRAYQASFGLPISISNTANNYGPYMFPEKLLPLAITNLLEGKKVPIYGDGKYVRDWLYVEDHCRAIDLILQTGKPGETYCIGGLLDDVNNLELITQVLKIMGKDESDIEFVKDRPGHDRRYAIDYTKATRELGYKPACSLSEGLEMMIQWYINHPEWWQALKSGAYLEYYKKQYIQR